jgi:hypothetical protein
MKVDSPTAAAQGCRVHFDMTSVLQTLDVCKGVDGHETVERGGYDTSSPTCAFVADRVGLDFLLYQQDPLLLLSTHLQRLRGGRCHNTVIQLYIT